MKNKSKTVLARITDEQHDKLIAICNAKDITVSEWVRDRINKSKELKKDK